MRPLPLSRGRLALLAAVAAAAVLSAIVLLRHEPATAPGAAPEPLAPFGLVRASEVAFVWAIPGGGAPVRVEVLDAGGRPLWRSDAVVSDRLRPAREVVAAWPVGDLFWRPVAEPRGGPAVPGDLAAFTLAR